MGGNLIQRHGIFRPLARRDPILLRVPSLRNVAQTAPYFHDGSAPTLEDAVGKMGSAQLNFNLSHEQVETVVAFLKTLTGNYAGRPVRTADLTAPEQPVRTGARPSAEPPPTRTPSPLLAPPK